MSHEIKVILNIFAVSLFVLITLPLSGCSGNGGQSSTVKNSSITPSSSPASQPSMVTVNNSSGSLSISAPAGWKAETDLWPESDISLSGRSNYIAVLKKPKSNYAAGYTVNDLLTAFPKDPYLKELVHSMNLKPSKNITLNGLSGVTAQMTAMINGGGSEVYLISVVADNNNFYEIIGWTSADSLDMDLNYLQTVMNNFKLN
jgi:hypothetical protein